VIRAVVDDSYSCPVEPTKLAKIFETAARQIKDKKVLDLPDDILIVLTVDTRLVPSESPGLHDPLTNTIYLCGLYGFEPLISVLCHELVHAEQVHKGRLTYVEGDPALKWDGLAYHQSDDQSDEYYRSLPWEKDAFEREGLVLQALFDIAGVNDECRNDLDETKSESYETRTLH
jgi:hypothetical protein